MIIYVITHNTQNISNSLKIPEKIIITHIIFQTCLKFLKKYDHLRDNTQQTEYISNSLKIEKYDHLRDNTQHRECFNSIADEGGGCGVRVMAVYNLSLTKHIIYSLKIHEKIWSFTK